MNEPSKSPISHPVNVNRLSNRGDVIRIDATEEQRRELAEFHGLEGIESLRADLLVAPWKRNGVRVSGTVKAVVDQLCVVSLEPLRNTVSEKIDQVFLPEKSKLGREGFGLGGEIVLSMESDDAPELFSGDWIDVGAIAEEFFGLGIDQYPHKPELSPDAASDRNGDEPAEQKSQFADKLRSALDKASKGK